LRSNRPLHVPERAEEDQRGQWDGQWDTEDGQPDPDADRVDDCDPRRSLGRS
jgi:hypothetical protein